MSEEAKDLASGESLSVKGTYADAAWKLHPWRLVVLTGLGIAVIVFVAWLWRRARRRKPVEAAKPVVAAKAAPSDKPAPGNPAPHATFADPLFIAAGAVSAIAIGLLTWGVGYYQEQVQYSIDDFEAIVSAVLIVVAYVLAIVGPLVWVSARRRDWRPGVFGFVWLAIFLVVMLLIYSLGIKPLLEVAEPPYMPGGSIELNSGSSARDLKAE
jgi:hypothetical protein